MNGLIIFGILVLIVLAIFARALKVVREYQRIVLFRLGRAIGLRGPGLVFIFPVMFLVVLGPAMLNLTKLFG